MPITALAVLHSICAEQTAPPRNLAWWRMFHLLSSPSGTFETFEARADLLAWRRSSTSLPLSASFNFMLVDSIRSNSSVVRDIRKESEKSAR